MTAETIVELDDAFLTGYRQGPTAADPAHGPRYWMRGTAYTAAGDLVPHARRTWSPDNANAPIPCDPERVDPPTRAERLEGRWLYAGHWTRHFGHCLLEVLPTLWPEPDGRLDGIVVHRSIRSSLPLRRPHGGPHLAGLTGWQADLLDLAGYGGLPVRVVRGRPVQVDELVVPSRPVVFRTEARPAAVDLWRRSATPSRPRATPPAGCSCPAVGCTSTTRRPVAPGRSGTTSSRTSTGGAASSSCTPRSSTCASRCDWPPGPR